MNASQRFPSVWNAKSEAIQKMTRENKLGLIKQFALEFANEIREALAIGAGLIVLPPGEVQEPHHCVLAVALRNGWHSEINPQSAELAHDDPKNVNWEHVAERLTKYGYDFKLTGDEAWCDIEHYDRQTGKLIDVQYVLTHPHGVEINLPPAITEFVNAFDNEAYPDLILGSEEFDDQDDYDNEATPTPAN